MRKNLKKEVAEFNYLVDEITNDGRCSKEIKAPGEKQPF